MHVAMAIMQDPSKEIDCIFHRLHKNGEKKGLEIWPEMDPRCLLCGKGATVVAEHYGRNMPFCTKRCSDTLCDLVEHGPATQSIGPKLPPRGALSADKSDKSDDPAVQALVAQLGKISISLDIDANGPTVPIAAASWASLPLEIKLVILAHVPILDFVRTARVSREFRDDAGNEEIWRMFYKTHILSVIPASKELIFDSWRTQAIAYLSVSNFAVRDPETGHIVKALPFAAGYTGPVLCINYTDDHGTGTITLYNTRVLNQRARGPPYIDRSRLSNIRGLGGVGLTDVKYRFQTDKEGLLTEPVSVGRAVPWSESSGDFYFSEKGFARNEMLVPNVVKGSAITKWNVPNIRHVYVSEIYVTGSGISGMLTAKLLHMAGSTTLANNRHCVIKSRFVFPGRLLNNNSTTKIDLGFSNETLMAGGVTRGSRAEIEVTFEYELHNLDMEIIEHAGRPALALNCRGKPMDVPTIKAHAPIMPGYERAELVLRNDIEGRDPHFAVPTINLPAAELIKAARAKNPGAVLADDAQILLTAVVTTDQYNQRLGVILEGGVVVPFTYRDRGSDSNFITVNKGTIAKEIQSN